MITIDLQDNEAELFIMLRKAKFFELKDTDIIIHKNKTGVITDIKKSCVNQKKIFTNLYRREKNLTSCLD